MCNVHMGILSRLNQIYLPPVDCMAPSAEIEGGNIASSYARNPSSKGSNMPPFAREIEAQVGGENIAVSGNGEV